jgi:predicted transcriptional regulator
LLNLLIFLAIKNKSPERVEFEQLAGLWFAAGRKRTDVASALGVTRSAVTQYLSGKSNPSERMLVALRTATEGLQGAAGRGEDPGRKILQDLAWLKAHAPDRYKVAQEVVATIRATPVQPADPPAPRSQRCRPTIEEIVTAETSAAQRQLKLQGR